MLKIAYHPIFKHNLPLGHRFPMSKYELLHRQLLHEGTCEPQNFFKPGMPDDKDILAVHTPDYVQQLRDLSLDKKAVRKLGFPLSAKLVEREHLITQGTIRGAQLAMDNGIAMNIAGGTHHAYTDHGEAFCLFNDQAIAASWLLRNKKSKKVLIVDLDVHQGNGTAEIFSDTQEVFTFSMHGASNYPFKKEVSDLDIALADGTGDQEFLGTLQETLPGLIKEQQPDFIFYLSGVDIIESDKLGRLACSVEGCKKRDQYVLKACHDAGIPVQVSMGGGYSPDIKTIIECHANTYRAAQEIFF